MREMEAMAQHEQPHGIPNQAEAAAGESTSGTAQRSIHFGRRKVRIGRVLSNKPDKTIVVAIERLVMHPLYKKPYRKTTKVMAHDEHNQCRIGDIVKIVEWRPLSRRKRWMLVDIVQRSHQLGEESAP